MRTVRYRQVLKHRIGNTGGKYQSEVARQQEFWYIEDKHPAPTIVQVRKLHSFIGSWDSHTEWVHYVHPVTLENRNYLNVFINDSLIAVYPKACYKHFTPYKEQVQAWKHWRESVRKTEEFFESMEV